MSPPSASLRIARRLNALLDRISVVGSALVLPLALLLFAQWPLRDVVGAGSRPANDLAQWVFALYVALALRQATQQHSHLAADTLAARYELSDELSARLAGINALTDALVRD